MLLTFHFYSTPGQLYPSSARKYSSTFQKNNDHVLDFLDMPVAVANGQHLRTIGLCDLTVNVNGVILNGEFHISDCEENGIIGMNIMGEQNATLDIGRRRLFINNKSVRLFDIRGVPFTNKVVGAITTHISPRQECILPGRACIHGKRESQTVSSEPTPTSVS